MASTALLLAVLCAQGSRSLGRTVLDHELVFGAQQVLGGVNGENATEVESKELTEGAFRDVKGADVGGLLSLRDVQDDGLEWSQEREEGRHHKRRRKMLARLAVWLQALGLGLVLPSVLGLVLFAAWKGVTLSLMALMLAGIVGINGLVASATKSSSKPQHVILSGVPTHHKHYWKRSDLDSGPTWEDSAHHYAYRAYS